MLYRGKRVLTSELELDLRPASHARSAAAAAHSARAAHLAKETRERVLPAKHLREDGLGLVAGERCAAASAGHAPAVEALLADLVVHVALLGVGEHLVCLRHLQVRPRRWVNSIAQNKVGESCAVEDVPIMPLRRIAARLTFLKFSSASSFSCGFLSGWYLTASFL